MPIRGRSGTDFAAAGLLVVSMLLDLGHQFWWQSGFEWMAKWPVIAWIFIVFTPLVALVMLIASKNPTSARLTLGLAGGVLFLEHLFSITDSFTYHELNMKFHGGWLAIPGLLLTLAAIILLYMASRTHAARPAQPSAWPQQFGGQQPLPQWPQPTPGQPAQWAQPGPGIQQPPAGYPSQPTPFGQPAAPSSGGFPLQHPGFAPTPQQPGFPSQQSTPQPGFSSPQAGFAPTSQPGFASAQPGFPSPGFASAPQQPTPQPSAPQQPGSPSQPSIPQSPNTFGPPQSSGSNPTVLQNPGSSPTQDSPEVATESTVHLPPTNPPEPQD